MNGRVILVLASLAAAAPAFAQQARELTLREALAAVEKEDPRIKAAEERQVQASDSVSIAESSYYPTVSFGAVQTYGFPGSSGGALQMQGLLSSPYRSGPAAGLFSQLTVFDLQREYGLKVSRYRLRSAAERERIQRLQTDLQALDLFVEAALDRSQWETWRRIGEQTQAVADIVQRFARTGQHSVVSLRLVEDQKNVSDIA
ncbi:MAG TPA: TolC family protein, partial [Elusimicrobiota bacterium]|nr:TolC family protein [Elusimicrobiota bacterium]